MWYGEWIHTNLVWGMDSYPTTVWEMYGDFPHHRMGNVWEMYGKFTHHRMGSFPTTV